MYTYDPNLEAQRQISDLDLVMEILKHSGYEFQKIKTRRYLEQGVQDHSGIKGMDAHAFNLSHTLCWRPTAFNLGYTLCWRSI